MSCRGVNLSMIMVLGPLQFWVLGGTQDVPGRLADGSVSQGLSSFYTFLGHHLEVSDQSVPTGAGGGRGAHRKPPGIWWLPPHCAGHVTGSEGEGRGSICCCVPGEVAPAGRGQAPLWPRRELRMLSESHVTPPPGAATALAVLACMSASLSRLGPASPTRPREASLTVSSSPACGCFRSVPGPEQTLSPVLGSHFGKAPTCSRLPGRLLVLVAAALSVDERTVAVTGQ